MSNGFKFNDVGTCPLCGSTLLEYGMPIPNGVLNRPWHCNDCQARGSEIYELQFVTHLDVIDKAGNEVDVEPQDLDAFKDCDCGDAHEGYPCCGCPKDFSPDVEEVTDDQENN